MSLLVIGTVAFDALETPFGKVDKITGGSANYICQAAAHFTQDLQLVAVIGDDFDKEELKYLQAQGVDLEGLQTKIGEKSFFWSGRYHMDMNTRDTLATELNVLADFDPILPNKYKNTPYLILGNIEPSLQKKVIQQMETRPKLIALDTMNFWMTQTPEALAEVLTMVDVLIVNDEEARMLSKQHSLVRAAQIIKTMGPKYIIIKKGEHGALLFHNENIFYAPALPLEEVFDPTGAGDSFAGGFMGFLASTDDISFENMKRAIIYGSTLASFCVEKFGPQRLKEINTAQINDRVQVFLDLVEVDITLKN